jgi:multidrug efflux pump subunit AcrB
VIIDSQVHACEANTPKRYRGRPEDDQGALFVIAQLPGGASVARTTEVVERAQEILREEEAVEDITAVIGLNFIDNYSQANAAFLVVTLKPFEERKNASLGVRALTGRLNEKFRQIQGGTVVPLAPPPIIGLGTGVGLPMSCRICAAATLRQWPRHCAAVSLLQTRTRS